MSTIIANRHSHVNLTHSSSQNLYHGIVNSHLLFHFVIQKCSIIVYFFLFSSFVFAAPNYETKSLYDFPVVPSAAVFLFYSVLIYSLTQNQCVNPFILLLSLHSYLFDFSHPNLFTRKGTNHGRMLFNPFIIVSSYFFLIKTDLYNW
jgi:hypothetical protein